jgi:predicted kinase
VGFYVVVSGLPASGKTTLARPLADALGLPLVSKDAIKEALFEAVGTGDWHWSKALSRAADAALVALARELDAAVLDNFWYQRTARDLLTPLNGTFVEVCCRCDPGIALARFRARERHAGHGDGQQGPDQQERAFREHRLPLGNLGAVLDVDTQGPVDIGGLAAWVVAHRQSSG